MDNLTHALTGALIARTLPARWTGELAEPLDPDARRPGRWVMLASIIAANLPDFEVLVLWPPPLGDKAAYLMHHRGWSHSLVGIAAEVVAFTGLLWLLARWRRTAGWFAGFTPTRGLAVAVLGAYSHLFLDWWNSYGVRLFYPWDKTWYYGDLVFIVDPWVWLMLGGALVCGTRRFGRTKWWWYALTGAATAVVAGACWQEQCPWWVLAGWCTGAIEIALLRWWWGRWRAAPLVGGGMLAAYLLFAAWVTASIRGTTAPTRGPYITIGVSWQREQTALAALPVAGVPWEREAIGMSRFMHPLLQRSDIPRREAWRTRPREPWSVQRRGFPGRSFVPENLSVLFDDPDVTASNQVRAWRAFARFPVATFEEKPSPHLRLGDLRYSAGGESDWSELQLPISEPLAAAHRRRLRLDEQRHLREQQRRWDAEF